jgi:hypothetical protein
LARAKEFSIPINDEGKGDIFKGEIWIGPYILVEIKSLRQDGISRNYPEMDIKYLVCNHLPPY